MSGCCNNIAQPKMEEIPSQCYAAHAAPSIPLALPAACSYPVLPPYQGERQQPIRIQYLDLILYVSFEYKCCEQYPGGKLHKLTISYRQENTSLKSRTGFGKTIISESYTPVAKEPIPRGADIPEKVIFATLNKVFFPHLIDKMPEIMNRDMSFALLGPVAPLNRLKQLENYAVSTYERKRRALDTMLELFGHLPIYKIVLENCAAIMLESISEKAPFLECVRLMRALFESQFSQIVDDNLIWAKYHPAGFRKQYSPRSRARSVFLHQSMDCSLCYDFLLRCRDNIADPMYGARYFMAALMLLSGINPSEACALREESIAPLNTYPDSYSFTVDSVIDTIGTKGTMTADGKSRHRSRQHRVKKLDKSESPQVRRLPLCKWLVDLWKLYLDSHPTRPSIFILSNQRNAERNLAPEDLSDWLDETFGDLLLNKTFKLATEEVAATFHVKDYLAITAEAIFSRSHIQEEGIRRLLGLPAQHTDATNYIDFWCDPMLLRFDNSIDRWIANLFGSAAPLRNSAKYYPADGHPGSRGCRDIGI